MSLVRPRVFAQPKAYASLGDQAVAFSRRVGLTLDPEQEMILAASLGVREDGRWQAFEVGLNVPRQNGKGEILMARELFGLYELRDTSVVHSAHEFKTSERHFQRIESAIRASPELLAQVKTTGPTRYSPDGRVTGFRRGHGDEAVELVDGRRIEFKTRTKSGMRGFDDVALLVLDEAMILAEEAHGSMLPTVRASKAERGPQVWYAGSAADQSQHSNSIVWARVRERGIRAEQDPAADESLVYAEWSLDFETPDEVPDDAAADPENWRAVNFAIARGRVLEEHMAREFKALGRRQFVVELLGVGDYPATDTSADLPITDEQWKAVEDRESLLLDPVCIAFDVSPDRRTSIVAAGANATGQLHVEVISARSGTGWVAERLLELYEKHAVAEIVCDGLGPSVAIARKIDEAGVTVRRANSTDYAEACGIFVDQVAEGGVRHIGQDELATAIRGARVRPLLDRYAWSRTKSVGDVGPLVASSLALWSAVDRGVLIREMNIY